MENENKSSTKNYLIGAVVLIVIVILVVLFSGSKKSAEQSAQAVQAVNAVSTTTGNTSATPATNLSSSSALVGNWVSKVLSKGMQGSGQVTLQGKTYKVGFTGDVNLVVQRVENNSGVGTITFSNLCLTSTTSASGQPDVTKSPQCLGNYSQQAVMQIKGNTISYTGPTVLGASLSLTGTFTNDSISGTFTRTSTSGKISGTFNLVRAKN